ncbi:DNA-directed DNA polymerase [Handroanthus impetiginosus]|uniref:DNA-directed DNA polymerase n=1 Tax=Handroanthus impetiginosus TaxID=429701 RepID=A0A2G9HRT0_9LAMI|nr:DNA-directed DNA polymerase [Handroanthus impetiginosus]
MVEGTQSKEMHETLKKQEVLLVEKSALLVEKRAQCQAGERQYKVLLRQQYNKGKSILGEGLLAAGDKASNSHHGYKENKVGESDGYYQSNSTPFPKVEFPYFDGLEEGYLTGSLISGLKEEIQGSVLASKPKNFQHAISLAKTFEKSVDALISLVGGGSKVMGNRPIAATTQQPGNSTLVRMFSNPSKRPYTTKVDFPTPVRRLLTVEEMKVKREKNLCYNCDEIYTPDHRYKQRHVLIVTAKEKKAYTGEFVSSEVLGEEVVMKEGKMSLNAMQCSIGEGSIGAEGIVAGKRIQILIDNGSTRSFIDERIAEKLNFERNYDSPLIVSMADGYTLTSRVTSPKFSWSIHNLAFTHPIKIMKLSRYDMLKRHEPVLLDLENIKITIKYQEEVSNHSWADKEVNKLLGEFGDVFEEPKSLPPNREIEHKIQLLPNATPKRQAPYRYSHAQKNEIENVVQGMLDAGIIKPSQSSFASLILLVNKKDRTWKMCVDYRYLNSLTVKHNPNSSHG